MHRRVAQTVAAVLPHYGWDGLRDPSRVTNEAFYAADRRRPNSEGSQQGISGGDYHGDPHDHPDAGVAQWRRMDSHGESILSGLSDDENDNRMRGSPESLRRASSLGRVAEEDDSEDSMALPQTPEYGVEYDATDVDEELEWELEENGLYLGSYKRLLAMYTMVPLTALTSFAVVVLLPWLFWPCSTSSRYPSYSPSPIPELVLSSAVFSLAHLLRVPLYSISLSLLRPSFACLVSTFLNILVVNVLRLMSLIILEVRHYMKYPTPTWQDPSFRTVWWLSLNVAEVLVALVQDYRGISFYRDVMVPRGREREFLERLKQNSSSPVLEPNGRVYDWRDPSHTFPEQPIDPETEGLQTEALQPNAAAIASQIDKEFDRLIVVKAREELEELYGVAVIKIPIFITCLQRFNSIILSLGLNLLLSAAFLRSSFSIPASDVGRVPTDVLSHSSLLATFPVVLVIHMSLASLYTPTFLPRIGVHTAAYVGVLVSLMSFFAGLAVWGALS
ncbi:hypothetical protein PISMIDRAFT_223185 [Pisolithus microcarpus 441]|uniref:Uncharacterized protein n=1 Tax=Pisolithus microcarpus 441 TaxID=765257 RepID=A0A0C9XYM4_9AGAM|nr:hypothetical protein PISMIDRAFT_223185 [Pisolithus microcarpus 441]